MNRDENGIIGQIQPEGWVEGGDSVCWMGHWLFLNNGVDPQGTAVKNVNDYINFFEVKPGAYVRHPVPKQTYNGFGAHYKNPWNGCISRDQFTGILAALVIGKKYKAMFRIVLHHMTRLMLFSYNNIKNGSNPETANWKIGDLTLFDIWATQIRGLGPIVSILLYPLLMIFDLHILLSAIYTNFEPESESDVINHVAKLMIAKRYFPTPLSLLAWRISDRDTLLRKLERYFCTWRDNCEFITLYEKALK